MRLTIAFVGLALLSGTTSAFEQPGGPQSSSKSHAHDFVIFTTVFTEQGFALSGARVRVRRSNEKKFRWEAMSDRRGELAFRVPQDSEYEMTVEARGYKTLTRKVDGTEGNRADLTIRMEPLSEPHTDSGTGGKS
ncbi:MAG TPA: carboxypeptidase-like regulatory domain-containing protein [Candidatus Acidoferrales bacterium]|nr:carboxypeptidase-like regulatory domain-containing protein [Candidatus Acidoferrales bacterium]